jgi:16S rRNA G966 N2-methylase RsmD
MPASYLHYGDNLDVLHRLASDELVDLVYPDPPFNSNTTHNVLFAEHGGAKDARFYPNQIAFTRMSIEELELAR